MTRYKYSTPTTGNVAYALGRHLPISTKFSVEICNYVRKRPLNKAKKMLENVIAMKQAVPIKRYSDNIGHKKTTPAAGSYPIKACTHILKVITSAEKNAQSKGMNTKDLVLDHINAHFAGSVRRHGRHSTGTKRTHIEVLLKEQPQQSTTPRKQSPKTKPTKEKQEASKQ